MRLYEVVYIFDAALDEAAIDKKLDRLHGVATKGSGKVAAVDHWGSRQLAYPVEGKGTGYYVVSHLEADPKSLPEFERQLKLEDDILRYLLVMNEGSPRPETPCSPPVLRAGRKTRTMTTRTMTISTMTMRDRPSSGGGEDADDAMRARPSSS